ncbi:cystathionine beta-lyase family protein involved in aluminum resistance [Pullulanibacillus pueri]|uniref:Cystathionine beta-lyase family protein involved in aluminum resistance n=1 Tax=Pullulanibacillus pueri TaxID=1437324 RepID=A0A8J2ZZN0_9BACL|nr:methionine gamma-lyase family protein [Pullulanibacillus pueri]MBM7684145.1 cystathionine beta-lyase family protein involved in aluminum resistance [Pullulanibacillus pueri]GGH88758.1 hypothetical protein GCM10007096_41820 [Pullulanibacillus pueri]
MFEAFKNGGHLEAIERSITLQIQEQLRRIEKRSEVNQWRVLEAFRKQRVSDSHLLGTTGYGYDDFGRETLEAVYAEIFGAEAGLVRPQIISGTHAITIALFGVLRPGDELVYITGKPYDTLDGVIGLKPGGNGSLKDFGIQCQTVPLREGEIDVDTVLKSITPKVKMLAIQRSRGYDQRPSLTIHEIEEAIKHIKARYPDIIVFVDNCYGEFVETVEPSHVGADLVAGSLIKNPGAGLVKVGGYIVGREDLVNLCAERLTAPGLGKEVGPTLHHLADIYQGIFMAPHTTAEALKGAVFSSAMMEKLGMETNPKWHQERTDLVQSVTFNDAERMTLFCQAIQAASPINAHVKPEPSPMPGYDDPVIMAAGTFVQGSSIELSADGPLRPPYTVFVQGGLTYTHVKYAILSAVDLLIESKVLSLEALH